MAKERNALKAGLFIVISVALIFAIVVAIAGSGRLFAPVQVRTVTFSLKDDVGGLRPGDDVRIGGFRVGTVRSMAVGTRRAPATMPADAKDEPAILVTFTLPREFVLRKEAVVSIQTTVTGQSCLNFESLGSGDALAAGEPLVGLPSGLSVAFSALRDAAPRVSETVTAARDLLASARGQTLPKVNIAIDKAADAFDGAKETAGAFTKTGRDASALIQEVRGHIKPIIDKYNMVADSASGMMSEIRAVFGDTRTDFRTTVANLKDATGSIREKLPPILDKVDRTLTGIDGAITSANEALVDVKKTVENTREMTAAARSVLVGNKGRLDAMIASLKTTSDNVKFATAELRHAPWKLLYRPPRNERYHEDLMQSARDFAEGANDLNEAATALRDALNDKDADPQQIRRLMERVEKSFANFNSVEEKLWAEVKP